MTAVSKIAISLHCWKGDDVGGFENTGGTLGGGIAVTGNYLGKARNASELRADIEKALSLIPGSHRLKLSPKHHLDAVECKLFGIGSESYVVGSHEFYMGYAIKNQKLLCLDAGHFHPTETIIDKITSTLMNVPEILLHVSRDNEQSNET